MGVEHDYENTHRNYTHWRPALAACKTGEERTTLLSVIDKGLAGDCRTGRMRGLSEMYWVLVAALGNTTPAMEQQIEEAFDAACIAYPANKKTLSDFYSEAIFQLNQGGSDSSLPTEMIADEVLLRSLKNHATAQVEPAIGLASRRRQMPPQAIEVSVIDAIGGVNYSKMIQKIKEGSEVGANAVRASIYSRCSAEEANTSLLGSRR